MRVEGVYSEDNEGRVRVALNLETERGRECKRRTYSRHCLLSLSDTGLLYTNRTKPKALGLLQPGPTFPFLFFLLKYLNVFF